MRRRRSAGSPHAAALAAAAALALVAPPSQGQAQAARRPYLQQGTPHSMTVVWRTVEPAASVVCWGTSPEALTSRAAGPAGVTDHVVTIAGLDPDTRYHYAPSETGACPPPAAGDPSQTFRTSPPLGARRPFSMWVVGDSGTGGTAQREVYEAMLAEVGSDPPDLFLHMGDMAYTDGRTSEFDSGFFAVYEDLLKRTVVWPTLGNHEGRSSDSDTETGPYYEAYVLPIDGAAGGLPSGTEAFYSFDYANVHFVVLDSHDSDRSVGGTMLSWLEDDLASTGQQWLIAYWHHPPYTHGTHDSDNETQLRQMRENALPILEAAGVDVVLSGHSHIYERSHLVHGAYDTPTTAAGHIVDPGDGRPGSDGPYDARGEGAVYVVAGHGGAGVGGAADHPLMFFSELVHGSCLLEVDGGALTLRNIRRDGVETDRVTLVKEDGIFLSSPVGGERYLASSTVDVQWTSAGTSGEVRIEYSLDGGGSWAPVVERTADDGHHPWRTPARATTAGLVRVTDLADSAKTDRSPAPFALTARADVEVIPLGSVWEYDDTGAEPAAEWMSTSGGWPSGAAQLGYGDGDERTVLADRDPNTATYYFRRTITVSGTPTRATLRVLHDDGFAAFVNGTQVLSANVDEGLAHETYASSTSRDDAVLEGEIDPGVFAAGDNVIAVLVKQGGPTSSDVSFDLSLELSLQVELDPDPPDAGPIDPDAGSEPDAAAEDLDGSRPPADASEDSGAAAPVDSGTATEEGGCGCRIGGPGASARADGPAEAWPVRVGGPLAMLAFVTARAARRPRRRGRRARRGG